MYTTNNNPSIMVLLKISLIFIILQLQFQQHYVFALECYSCSSKTNEACKKPEKSTIQRKHCGLQALNETKFYAETVDYAFSKLFQVDISSQEPLVPTNCLKQVSKVGSKEYIIRGCQLAATDKLDICVKVKEVDKDTLNTVYCSLCNTDGCNTAGLKYSPLNQLLLILILILTAFFNLKTN